MNEIEQALGRLGRAVEQLKDKLDGQVSASFSSDSSQSSVNKLNAQAIDIAELKSIKRQISNAISLMEQMTSNNDKPTENNLILSKKDHQSGEGS